MNNTCLFVGILAVALTFGSCGVFKKRYRRNVHVADTTVVRNRPAESDTNNGIKPAFSPEQQALVYALRRLWEQDIPYSTFSGKAKMHYEGRGDKQDFTAHFRIQKDHVIWASITALGGIVQVARLYITPDSLKMLNYLDKDYTAMALADASKILPVPADFSALQNLVVGNIISKHGEPTDATDAAGTLMLVMTAETLTQQAKWNKADSTLRSLLMRMTNGQAVMEGTMQYGNYQSRSNRRFADFRTVNVISNGEQYYVDMNFANVEFDKPLEFPFSVPKNFQRK